MSRPFQYAKGRRGNFLCVAFVEVISLCEKARRAVLFLCAQVRRGDFFFVAFVAVIALCEKVRRTVPFNTRKFDAASSFCAVLVAVIFLCVKVRRIIPSSEALDPINAIFEGRLNKRAIGRCKLNIFILQ